MKRPSVSELRERLERASGLCENCGRPAGIRERDLEGDEILCPTCASEARAWMLEEEPPGHPGSEALGA